MGLDVREYKDSATMGIGACASDIDPINKVKEAIDF